MSMSPLMAQMAFAHANTDSPEQFFTVAIWGSKSSANVRQILNQKGLIDDNGKGTDKLRFWVDHVCKIPWPEMNYIIPRTG